MQLIIINLEMSPSIFIVIYSQCYVLTGGAGHRGNSFSLASIMTFKFGKLPVSLYFLKFLLS